MRIVRMLTLLGLATLHGYPSTSHAREIAAPPIPIEQLFRDNDFAQLKISPDGKYLAGSSLQIGEASGRTAYNVSLWRYEIATGELVPIINAPNNVVTYFDWVDDTRIICSYYADGTHWLAFDVDGSNQVQIYPFTRDLQDYNLFLRSFEHFTPIDPLVNEKDFILIECDWNERRWRTGNVPDSLLPAGLYKVNTRTLEYELVAISPALTSDWLINAKGDPVLHFGYSPKLLEDFKDMGWRAFSEKAEEEVRAYRLAHRRDEEGAWVQIDDLPCHEKGFVPCAPLDDSAGFSFLAYNGGETRALFQYIPGEGVRVPPLVQDPKSDVAWFQKDRFTAGLTSVYTEYLEPEPHFIDPIHLQLHQKLKPVFPGSTIIIQNSDRKHERFVVLILDSGNPGEFYLVDTGDDTVRPIFRINPWLWEYPMGETRNIEIRARDGQRLPGYLTFPPGKDKSAGPMPMILKVRGGPWKSRDSSSFDFMSQFYATRGFAVLEINFRGSLGFGKTFEEMGKYRHGDWMFTDVIDAAHWAINENLTKTGLLGIAGSSYGGYAALRALAEHPELFEFGISLNGVPDFIQAIEFLETKNRLRNRTFATDWLGDPDIPEEREILENRSPFQNYHTIIAPLFLYYSMRDSMTPYRLHRDFAERLKKADKPVTTFSHRYEGHNPFHRREIRIELVAELETFLNQQKKRIKE